MNSSVTDRICGLLEQKIHFLEEVLDSSKILAGLPYESHETEWNNLLKTRQRYLESLENLEPTLREHLKSIDGTDPYPDNEQIKQLKAKASELITQILALDEHKKLAMLEEMQQAKNKLKVVRQGRKGIAGYNNAGRRVHIAGAFTDNRR